MYTLAQVRKEEILQQGNRLHYLEVLPFYVPTAED